MSERRMFLSSRFLYLVRGRTCMPRNFRMRFYHTDNFWERAA